MKVLNQRLKARVTAKREIGKKIILGIDQINWEFKEFHQEGTVNAVGLMIGLEVGDVFVATGDIGEYKYAKSRIKKNKFLNDDEDDLKPMIEFKVEAIRKVELKDIEIT